jgi:hypothetical protein
MVFSGAFAAYIARPNHRSRSWRVNLSVTGKIAMTVTSKDSSFAAQSEATSLSIGVANQTDNEALSNLRKYHHLTVCVVPPEASEIVWDTITKCRTQLCDPGLFRWPPHANLLYPFLDIRPGTSTVNGDDTDTQQDPPTVRPEIIAGLVTACCQVEPFRVQLQNFGTFGSKKRGVLWLAPDSSCCYDNDDDEDDNRVGGLVDPPLMRLQSHLCEAFPTCDGQNKKSVEGFKPHMTLSHFINLDEALAAQNRVQGWWPADLSFPVHCIYLLQRFGDSGQFLRVADISLGAHAAATVHASPIPFRQMPETEADWVLEERMKLKKRRNGKGQRGDNSSSRRGLSRIPDSPEVVEAKRAARKAKRESTASVANADDKSLSESA